MTKFKVVRLNRAPDRKMSGGQSFATRIDPRESKVNVSPTERFLRALNSFVEVAEKLVENKGFVEGTDLLKKLNNLKLRKTQRFIGSVNMTGLLDIVDRFIGRLGSKIKEQWGQDTLEAQCKRLAKALRGVYENIDPEDKANQLFNKFLETKTPESEVRALLHNLGYQTTTVQNFFETLKIDRQKIVDVDLSNPKCIFVTRRGKRGVVGAVIVPPLPNSDTYSAGFFSPQSNLYKEHSSGNAFILGEITEKLQKMNQWLNS